MWDKCARTFNSIFEWVWITILACLGVIGTLVYVSMIATLLLTIVVIAVAGKAIVYVLMMMIVLTILSLIMYQDLSLFTVIVNYLSQWL